MKQLKKITLIVIMFLILSISIGWGVFPVIISALFSWWWLFLYGIHLTSILIISLCCAKSKEGIED